MRKMFRLGQGASIPPGHPSLTAQRIFLQTLLSLKDAAPAIRELTAIAATPEGPRADLGPEPAVLAWARRYHLTDSWLVRTMQEHVVAWRALPERRGRFVMFISAIWLPIWSTAPAWDPTWTTEADYRLAVDGYIREIKQNPAFVPAPEKRTLVHFSWLVQYQICGRPASAIAQEAQLTGREVDEKAVRKAIRETAAMIGLTLRLAQGRGTRKRTATQKKAS